MARGEAIRRRQAGVLVVGAAEPEIQSWLRAAGHLPRAVRRVSKAGAALEEEPVDLVIVDRDSSGLDAPEVCHVLREDPRLGDAWILAITVAAKGRMADSVLNAGADDYLHRPFTRAELIARTRAGLRAAQERANDRLLRTLMENVPGAIYRSAWHAENQLEMITDEIERISGYPPHNFLSSNKRTIITLVHPEDLDMVIEAIARLRRPRSRSSSSTGSSAPTARCAGCSTAASSSPAPATGCGSTARCSTSPSARAPRRPRCATRSRRPAPPSCAPRARASSRPPTRPAARSSVTSTTAPSSAWWPWCSTSRWPSGGSPRTRRTSSRSSRSSARTCRTRPPSCASSPAASIPRCSPSAG